MASLIYDNIDVTLPAETTGVNAGKVLKSTITGTLAGLKAGLTTAKGEITALQVGLSNAGTALDGKQDVVENVTTQELTDGTVTDARLFSPAQIKAAAEMHGGGSGADNPTTFTYNVDGELTSSTDTVTGEVTAFTYTDGNLTSLTVTLGASVKTQTFTYTNGVLTAVSALA